MLWGGGTAASIASEAGAEAISAASWTIHEGFDPSTVRNDLAIVRLSRASAKQPVYLDLSPTSGFATPGKATIALGELVSIELSRSRIARIAV